MNSQLRGSVEHFIVPLSVAQRTILALFFAIAMVAGILQGFVIRRALREGDFGRRLAGWGWDIRMLRRSYYPPSGQHLHPVIVRLYAVSIVSAAIVFLLAVSWLIL